jgi:dihydroxy-acid dehydratase
VINIDVKARKLDLEVSAAEIKKRLAGWKPLKTRYATGVFAKYARLVANASEGAVTS